MERDCRGDAGVDNIAGNGRGRCGVVAQIPHRTCRQSRARQPEGFQAACRCIAADLDLRRTVDRSDGGPGGDTCAADLFTDKQIAGAGYSGNDF